MSTHPSDERLASKDRPSISWRVNPFEQLMFKDDSPDSPMTFFLRLTVKGLVERSQLRKAFLKALQRHPLLNSLIVKPGRSRSLEWKKQNSATPWIAFGSLGQPLEFPENRQNIDITKESGVRLFVQECPVEKHAEWYFQFHHSATDGKGGSIFIEDLLTILDALSSNQENPVLDPIESDPSTLRESFGLSRADERQRRSIDWQRILQYFSARPMVMTSSKRDAYPAFPTDRRIRLDEVTFAKLKEYAKAKKVTINDVLLRDVMCAIHQWQSTTNRPQSGSCRIALAIDMRRDERFADLAAQNIVSMVFIDRTKSECADEDQLLRSLNEETKFIKKNYLGTALHVALRVLTKMPFGLQLLIRPNPVYPCHSTAVLSNLGRTLENLNLEHNDKGNWLAGNLEVEALELLPPFRKNTPVAIGVSTTNNVLRLALNYDSKSLSLEDAALLGDILKATIFDTLETWELDKESAKVMRLPVGKVGSGGPLWGLTIGKNVIPSAGFDGNPPSIEAESSNQ